MTLINEEQERAAFEAYASDNGKWNKAIERDSTGNYRLMQTHTAWGVWQARARLAAPTAELSDEEIIDIGYEFGAIYSCIEDFRYVASVRAILAKRGEL